jgi:hypothetical protein
LSTIKNHDWQDPDCKKIVDRWKNSSDEDVLTISTSEEWDKLFTVQQAEDRAFILAEGVRAHNHNHGKYLTLSDEADILFSMELKHPPEKSLAYMAQRINGSRQIAYATIFMLRVASILRAIAASGGCIKQLWSMSRDGVNQNLRFRMVSKLIKIAGSADISCRAGKKLVKL